MKIDAKRPNNTRCIHMLLATIPSLLFEFFEMSMSSPIEQKHHLVDLLYTNTIIPACINITVNQRI